MNKGLLPEEHLHSLLDAIAPAMRWDGKKDVAAWQAEAREKLAAIIGLPKIEACRTELAFEIEYDKICEDMGCREIRFRYQSEENVTIPCHLVIPNGATGRLPVAITLQGHSTGMHISLGRPKFPGDENTCKGGDRDFVARCVKEGVAGIALEQRCFGENGGNPEKGSPVCRQAAMRAILLGRTLVGERVFDIMRCIDVIGEHFSDILDPEKIICLGNSGGGTATIYAAALEPRIKIAVPSCAVCRYADSIGAMLHCECNFVPNVALDFDMGDLCAMVAPRSLIVVNGAEDNIFPINGAKACINEGARAYEALGASDKLAHVVGNAGHRFYADDAWPHIHKAIEML